jgi:drug/metabolite transporter (DMT)-like permease
MLNNRTLILVNFFNVYFIWGMTYIWMKIASFELHPFAIIFWQNLIATLLVLTFNYKKDITNYFRKNYFEIIKQSLLMLVFGVGFITISVDKLSASLASIIICSVPLWVSLITFVYEKKITPIKVLGVLTGFVGIFFLTKSEYSSTSSIYILLLLVASACWSFGVYRSKSITSLSDPYLTSAGQMLVAAIIYFVFFIINFPVSDLIPSDIKTIYSILSLATFGDALAFTSFIWLLRNISPVRVATYAYINPVVSLIMSWLILGEEIDLKKLPYVGLIILSVFITVSEKDKVVSYGTN